MDRQRLQALKDAIEIVRDCAYETAFNCAGDKHSHGCRCEKAYRRLRRIAAYLVNMLNLEATI